jgi:phosphopantothenoylcysteine decarboxylase/phosphopantothenate--cysteine ligase
MSAAVADYTIEAPLHTKIKKEQEQITLTLIKTKNILRALGDEKKENQFLVGFALETNDEKANALKKMKSKNADMIVLNSLMSMKS